MHRLLIGVILLTAVMGGSLLAADSAPAVNSEQALKALTVGNTRYVAGQPQVWSAGNEKRSLLETGQHPYACIVACSDSRVSPEILFDQSLGDLFVVRLAGNVVSAEAVGSVEYAIEHLRVPLVVIMGHTKCGAVTAACTWDGEAKGPVGSLVTRIKPAIDAAKSKGFSGDELVPAVATENARMGANALIANSRVIEQAVMKGDVKLLSAMYDLHTGYVAWQTQLMAATTTAEANVAAASSDATKTVQKTEAPVAEKAKPEAQPQKVAEKAPDKAAEKKAESYSTRRHR